MGDALTTLASDINGPVDLLVLDAQKGLYLEILRLGEPFMQSGALVVSDRSDLGGDTGKRDEDYLSYLADSVSKYVRSSIATRALGMFHSHEIAFRR